eukprot:123609-Chlamydomonas_euryale.AAC.6
MLGVSGRGRRGNKRGGASGVKQCVHTASGGHQCPCPRPCHAHVHAHVHAMSISMPLSMPIVYLTSCPCLPAPTHRQGFAKSHQTDFNMVRLDWPLLPALFHNHHKTCDGHFEVVKLGQAPSPANAIHHHVATLADSASRW